MSIVAAEGNILKNSAKQQYGFQPRSKTNPQS
jgi:hypothetical protein